MKYKTLKQIREDYHSGKLEFDEAFKLSVELKKQREEKKKLKEDNKYLNDLLRKLK